MNLILCDVSNCNEVFESVLELTIHKHENHDSLSDSQKQLFKRWIDVK
jgi:hypothetical protein